MEAVRGFVGSVGRRVGGQAMLEAVCGALALGAGCAAALVLAERVASRGGNAGLLAAVPLLAGCLAGLWAGARRWPSAFEAALAADARLGLAERLSTALTAGEGPMGELVRADAARRVAGLEPRQVFPIRPPARLRWVLLGVVGLLAAAFVPPLDLFGWGAARAARAAERAAVRRAADAARVGLGKLAGMGREEGFDGTARSLEEAERALGSLAGASEPTAPQAREVARKVQDGLNEAKAANKDALGKALEPGERARRESERDLLVSADRIVEGLRRELAGESAGGILPAAGKKGAEEKAKAAERTQAMEFVRSQEPPPAPRETLELEARLLETRPGAEAAAARDDIPWHYRPVVRRYFSPDE